jgi:hypothetical protein
VSLTRLAFRRTEVRADPALSAAEAAVSDTPVAAEAAVSDTLLVTEDMALVAPEAADLPGFAVFDSNHAALLGRSLSPVCAARDRRRAGLVFAISPPMPPGRFTGLVRPTRRSRS